MKRKQRRLLMIGAAGVVLAAATGLVLSALGDGVLFFRSPTDIVAMSIGPGERIRIGGILAEGSVVRDGLHYTFVITDFEHEVNVVYTGHVPDLFRECQGVVAEGSFGDDGVFRATRVLAKHDENYMPREVEGMLPENWSCTLAR